MILKKRTDKSISNARMLWLHVRKTNINKQTDNKCIQIFYNRSEF